METGLIAPIIVQLAVGWVTNTTTLNLVIAGNIYHFKTITRV